MPHWLVLAVLAIVFSIAISCSSDDSNDSVRFRTVASNVTIPSEGIAALPLQLTPDDTSFFGQSNADEDTKALELSLRSADDNTWISLHLLNVKNTRLYALDSNDEGRL